MNDDDLDLSDLDGTGIRLCFGITASLAKNGDNKLLAAFAKVFEQEY